MTDKEAVDLLLSELLTTKQLPRYKAIIEAHEEIYDLLPNLHAHGVVDRWQDDFLMVLPAGLALADAGHRDKIVAWTDGTKEALAQAHRGGDAKRWSVAELCDRSGLSPFAIGVALLYRSRFLP